MLPATFFAAVSLLYYLCFVLLAGLSLCIACGSSRRMRARQRLRRVFYLLALSLLTWQLTLFLEVRVVAPRGQLWLGRVNFAVVVFAAYLALRFVQEVSARATARDTAVSAWLLAETILLALLTLLTPFVSEAERVEAGRAITTFGPLFPIYLLHVPGCLAAAVHVAFRERPRANDRHVRRQLTLIAAGMLATASIAFVTNALLPYGFGDFRFCDLGTLSTLLFILAVAYATFVHGLFDLQCVIRKTLVYGILLAFVLGAYSSTVFLVTQYLTSGAEKLTQFAMLLIAFSFDPLRRFLEEKTDRLLFGERDHTAGGRGRVGGKNRSGGSRPALALLFPWRRR